MTVKIKMGKAHERIEAAFKEVEQELIALYQRHNGGALPSPEKVQEMFDALGQDQLERKLHANIKAAQDWEDLQALRKLPAAPGEKAWP